MSGIDRRGFVTGVVAAGTLTASACTTRSAEAPEAPEPTPEGPPEDLPVSSVAASPILEVQPLTRSPWPTDDPFLFCAYHLDRYPVGDAQMGPISSTDGRSLGRDFSGRDGWSMYHGRVVPGFPQHPHRGFETVTVTRSGLVDHSDSLGATARYGDGDTQWMTAGNGIVHAEMFPLRNLDKPNPLELFQVWLNLPAARKLVAPHFTMLWAEALPTHALTDAAGRRTQVRTISGALDGVEPPAGPPDSWASDPANHVAIWTIVMEPEATWQLPAAMAGLSRSLYLHRGDGSVAGRALSGTQRVRLHSEHSVTLTAGAQGAELLLLQGRPIGEPVAKRGPFVMNSQAEIQQAYTDYQSTRFGGWPWGNDAPTHAREQGRFALHADGTRDEPA